MDLWKKIFSRQKAVNTGVQKQELPPLEQYIRRPSVYPGIPLYSVDEILESQQEILALIRQVANCEDDHFDLYYMSAIRKFVAYAHLLPGSDCHHHQEAGGLVAHSLDVAYRALKLIESPKYRKKFPKAELSNQDAQKVRSLGCFVAGLTHDSAKIYSDMIITDRGGNQHYHIFASSLIDWLKEKGISYYQVRFRPGRHKKHESSVTLTVDSFLTYEIRSYLCSGEDELSYVIFSALHGIPDNIISKCVVEADQDSVREYLKSTSCMPSPAIGATMPPHARLEMAIITMLGTGAWEYDAPGGVAKVIDSQIHLVWPRAADEMIPILADDYAPAITRNPDEMAQILQDWGLIEEEQGSPYWFIDQGGTALKTVRLIGLSRWMYSIPTNVSPDRCSEKKEQQPSVDVSSIAEHQYQYTESDPVVQLFLRTLASPNPPFQVQVVDQNRFARKRDAEKWFAEHGVSLSQILRIIKSGQLRMVKIKTSQGVERLIGPSSQHGKSNRVKYA